MGWMLSWQNINPALKTTEALQEAIGQKKVSERIHIFFYLLEKEGYRGLDRDLLKTTDACHGCEASSESVHITEDKTASIVQLFTQTLSEERTSQARKIAW